MRDPTRGGIEQQQLFQAPVVERIREPRVPRIKDAVDEARQFGLWTLNKLEVLRVYLTQYRRVAGSGTYIDAFAGEGIARIDGQVVPGSARIALDSDAFRALHLFELPPVAARLERNLADHRRRDRVQIRPGDSNETVPALLASGEIDSSRPCFALLDPDSTQLHWATVEALAGYKSMDGGKQCKVELWILFNLQQAIQRLWPTDKQANPLPPYALTLDRVMGGRDAWIDLWTEGKTSVGLINRYCDRLRDLLGYVYVTRQLIADPTTGRPQYFMVHATDHDAAVKFMRWAKKTTTRELDGTEQFPGCIWDWV